MVDGQLHYEKRTVNTFFIVLTVRWATSSLHTFSKELNLMLHNNPYYIVVMLTDMFPFQDKKVRSHELFSAHLTTVNYFVVVCDIKYIDVCYISLTNIR